MDSRSNKNKAIRSIHVPSPWEQQTLLSFHQAHAAQDRYLCLPVAVELNASDPSTKDRKHFVSLWF
jgi:hypothetical protein